MRIAMNFDTVMDRPVERNVHYISPGGYELKFASGMTMNFDFIYSEGSIDETNPRIVHWVVRSLDESYGKCTDVSLAFQLKKNGVNGAKFAEFYVHTGEYDDPEITCVAIQNLSIEVGEETYKFPDFELGEDYAPKHKWIQNWYSWGEKEDPVQVPYGINAWDYAKKLAMMEVEVSFYGHEDEGPVGLELYGEQEKIVLHYNNDGERCYYLVTDEEDYELEGEEDEDDE